MMGRKGYLVPEIIKKILIDGEKSGKELMKLVYNELGFDIPKNFQKTYDQALIKLLEEESIKIVGYDPSCDNRKVKQAFKSDTLIFDSSKRLTRPDINDRLKKMNIDNDAYQKIRFLFKSRLKDFNNIEKSRWEYLNSWVFSISSQEIKEILSIYYDLDNILIKIKDLSFGEERALASWRERKYERPTKEDIKVFEIFDKDFEQLLLGYLLKVLSYYDDKDVKIWFYPATPENFASMFKHLPAVPEIKNFKLKSIDKNDRKSVFDFTYPLLFKPFIVDEEKLFIDEEGKWTKNDALYKFGFYEPYYVDNFDLKFENSVDIISTYSDDERAILYEILAKGLSDEPGSLQVFWEFYKKISKVQYKDRINNILGVFADTKRDRAFENLSQQDQQVLKLKRELESIDLLNDLPRP